MYQTPTVQKLGLIKPRKPPADSLVAPYNSTALPGGHNLIDQSDVYTLAAPTGGYNSTALPDGNNLAVPFDTKERLYSQPKKVGLTFDPNISVPSDISQDSENLQPLTYVSQNKRKPGNNEVYYSSPSEEDNTVESSSMLPSDVTYDLAASVNAKRTEHNQYHLPVPVKESESSSESLNR